jgi:hypothetical protein
MSSDTVYSAIQAYLTANWAATPLVFENDLYLLPDTPVPYVVVEISGQVYGQCSVGAESQTGNLWREDGLLWLHVFVPTGTGSLLARQYTKQLVDLFRGLDLIAGALRFRDASIGLGEAGAEDGNYWRLSASVEWRFDT